LAIEDARRLCLLLFVDDYLDALLTVYAKRVSAEMAPDHGDIGHEQDWAAIEDQLKRAMTNILRSSWKAPGALWEISAKIEKRIEHDRSSGDLSGVERNERILKFIDEI
jgi:hemoglobin-like flavoprotein